MALILPPLYGVEDITAALDKISKVDEEINELLIKREAYVKALKEQIEKSNALKD